MSRSRSWSGWQGLRGSFCRVESSADWLSSPMVMAPVEILYLFQSAFRINKLPEIPASSLQYALCDSDCPGTALIEMSWVQLCPRSTEHEEPYPSLYDPSLMAVAVPS